MTKATTKTRPPCLPIYPVGTLLRFTSAPRFRKMLIGCATAFSGVPNSGFTNDRLDIAVSCNSDLNVVYLGQGYTDCKDYYYIRLLHPEFGEVCLVAHQTNRHRAEKLFGDAFTPVNRENNDEE